MDSDGVEFGFRILDIEHKFAHILTIRMSLEHPDTLLCEVQDMISLADVNIALTLLLETHFRHQRAWRFRI